MKQDLNEVQSPVYLPVRFWLILHPVTCFFVLTSTALTLCHALGLFATNLSAPVLTVVLTSSVGLVIWKCLRRQYVQLAGTLCVGALFLYLHAMNGLTLSYQAHYGLTGVFGVLAAAAGVGMVLDVRCRRIYLKALKLEHPPALPSACGSP